MKPPNEDQALNQVVERLEALLDLGPAGCQRRPAAASVDLVVEVDRHSFVVEWKASGAAAHVALGIDQVVRAAHDLGPDMVPLLAVPYMGSIGRERCEEAGVSWLDLSGNARISAPGIRVRVEGRPNAFKRRGRPSSPFAPKAARIARWLLMHPDRWMSQREIALATLMDEGYTSRIVTRLEDDELLLRDSDGAIQVRDPDLLLDAWSEDYDFSKHRIRRGHVAARSGDQLLKLVSERLQSEQIRYAVTALPAAWLMTGFAGFRLVTLYAGAQPVEDLVRVLSMREDDRGANVWLVAPSDEGVFHGSSERDGIRCVHPVQAYLDLQGHPERAGEAAEELRHRLLAWDETHG